MSLVSRGLRPSALLLLLSCSTIPTVDPDSGERTCAAMPGRAWCAQQCVTLAEDSAHCGACGTACADGRVCNEGRCTRRFTDLSSSFNHTCAVEVGGAVWCWGADEAGQAGDGDQALARAVPVRVVDVHATRVFAGYTHTCARTTDGSLACWGANPHDELGNGASSAIQLTPVVARDVSQVAAMAVGAAFSCSADESGTTRCWGSNEWGGLGDGRSGRAQPVEPVGLAGVTMLGAGWGHVCALAELGAVWCWGSRGFAQIGDGHEAPITAVAVVPVQAIVEDVETLVVGNTVACARTSDDRVWCWGTNANGESGDGTSERTWTPAPVPGVEASALYGGFGTFFARRRDGSFVGWGKNDEGALGVAGGNRTVPVAVLSSLGSRVTRVVAGGTHACALLSDQTVRCWGGNNLGQVGNGDTGMAVLLPVELAW